MFFTGEGENIQVLFAQLSPPLPPQHRVIEQEDEDEDNGDDVEFFDNELFETDLFSDETENDLFVW